VNQTHEIPPGLARQQGRRARFGWHKSIEDGKLIESEERCDEIIDPPPISPGSAIFCNRAHVPFSH
jgi:hypothetical protein